MGLLLVSFSPGVGPRLRELTLESIGNHVGNPAFLGQGRCAIAAISVSPDEYERIACDLADSISDSGITGIDWFGGVGA